jgi:beta-1,4-N-acetylglucosaminyltransferase
MKIALVCTHGGHLTETLQVLPALSGLDIFFVTHYSARDDEIKSIAPTYLCENIGQRKILFLKTFFWALSVLIKERPNIIFSTGSEIALPFFFWGKFLKAKTFFLESFCRVNTPSRTGKFIYYLSDEFWVQWPSLLEAYGPKARFHGAVT